MCEAAFGLVVGVKLLAVIDGRGRQAYAGWVCGCEIVEKPC